LACLEERLVGARKQRVCRRQRIPHCAVIGRRALRLVARALRYRRRLAAPSASVCVLLY